MATFDFTPLYHSTVGFDRLSNLLAHALDATRAGTCVDLLPDWDRRGQCLNNAPPTGSFHFLGTDRSFGAF